jgi:hypothetical protein
MSSKTGAKKGGPRSVAQEHSARRLHWDLRLEHDGVAVSRAVPNGIPADPEENRKAVHVEDHPLSSASRASACTAATRSSAPGARRTG